MFKVMMKLISSETLILVKPIGEPDECQTYNEDVYMIERVFNEDNTIVWYGIKLTGNLKMGCGIK